MTDLISREALLKFPIRKHRYDRVNGSEEYIFGVEAVLEYAENLPAVDAEPVRYGKRTVYTIWHSSAWGEIHTKFECCGFDVRGNKKYNYCPNCGARMDGENNG